MSDTPRTDAAEIDMSGHGVTVHTRYVRADFARELERELAEVTAAIHKVHPTRRGSLVDMVEDLDSYRETAMNAFRLSERELAAERAEHEETASGARMLADAYSAERALADRLAGELRWRVEAGGYGAEQGKQTLTAWKEARRGTD